MAISKSAQLKLKSRQTDNTDAWSRVATNLPRSEGLPLERFLLGHELYLVTITATSNGTASPLEPGGFGPEYVLYELKMHDLFFGSAELHSDDGLEHILTLVQIEAKADTQLCRRDKIDGVIILQVGPSSSPLMYLVTYSLVDDIGSMRPVYDLR